MANENSVKNLSNQELTGILGKEEESAYDKCMRINNNKFECRGLPGDPNLQNTGDTSPSTNISLPGLNQKEEEEEEEEKKKDKEKESTGITNLKLENGKLLEEGKEMVYRNGKLVPASEAKEKTKPEPEDNKESGYVGGGIIGGAQQKEKAARKVEDYLVNNRKIDRGTAKQFTRNVRTDSNRNIEEMAKKVGSTNQSGGIKTEGIKTGKKGIVAKTQGSFPVAYDTETGKAIVLGGEKSQNILKKQGRTERVRTAKESEKKEVKNVLKEATQERFGEKEERFAKPTRYQKWVENGNPKKARRTWAEQHRFRGYGDKPIGAGYCKAVNFKDPACPGHGHENAKQKFCSSPLAGQPNQSGEMESCFTGPSMTSGNYNDANTILYEWAKYGVPLTDYMRNQLEDAISTTRLRANAGGGGTVVGRFVNKRTTQEIKDAYKEVTKELGYGPPATTFEGYMKYKYFKDNPKEVQKMQEESFYPLGLTPADIQGTGSFKQYWAAMAHPGRKEQGGKIVPQNNPFFGRGTLYHEKSEYPGGITAWSEDDAIETISQLQPKAESEEITIDELTKLGKAWDIAFKNQQAGTPRRKWIRIQNKVREEYGTTVEHEDFNQAIHDKYNMSKIKIGYAASGAIEYAHLTKEEALKNPKKAWIAWASRSSAGMFQEGEERGLDTPDWMKQVGKAWAKQNPAQAKALWNRYSGAKLPISLPETAKGEGLVPTDVGATQGGTSLFGGLTPQSTTPGQGGGGGTGGTETQGIMDTISNNPAMTLGAGAVLTYFLIQ